MRDRKEKNGVSSHRDGPTKKTRGKNESSSTAEVYSLVAVRMKKKNLEDRKHVDAILKLVKHYK